MATVTEIRNLTKSKSIAPAGDIVVEQTVLEKFVLSEDDEKVEVVGTFSAKIPEDFANANDNIEVSWTEGATTRRAVGGKLFLNKDRTTATISNLVDVSKYYFGLTGQLKIGTADAVVLSVRIGNIQAPHDWIIDFSDKEDGAPGSEIKLNELINWIKEKNKDANPEFVLPDVKKPSDDPNKPREDEKLKTDNFTIEFQKFYFNITQKTFDFWVTSKKDESITIGDFTIDQVGFRVTNVPLPSPIAEKEVLALTDSKKKLAPPKKGGRR
jgi:hypothetical protein